jgi:hypothetical protein
MQREKQFLLRTPIGCKNYKNRPSIGKVYAWDRKPANPLIGSFYADSAVVGFVKACQVEEIATLARQSHTAGLASLLLTKRDAAHG